MMLTLWDLIDPLLNKIVPPSKTAPKAKAPPKSAGPSSDRAKTFTTESTEHTEKDSKASLSVNSVCSVVILIFRELLPSDPSLRSG